MTYQTGQTITVYPLRRVMVQRVVTRPSGTWVRYDSQWHRASELDAYRQLVRKAFCN